MAQWRVELTTQDVVALSRGDDVLVVAVDEEDEGDASLEIAVSLVDL